MKCTKCGIGEVIFNDDVVRLDNKERVMYHHQRGMCNSCGMIYDKDVLPRRKGRNASALSIWALILGFFPMTSLLGIILAILDLKNKDERYSHYMSYLGLVFAGIWLVATAGLCLLVIYAGNHLEVSEGIFMLYKNIC